jgi:hypothetical protein
VSALRCAALRCSEPPPAVSQDRPRRWSAAPPP